MIGNIVCALIWSSAIVTAAALVCRGLYRLAEACERFEADDPADWWKQDEDDV